MWKVKSVKAWFNRARHWDTLVAFTSAGLGALRRLRLPEKPASKKPKTHYRPAVSTLEQRESPQAC